MRIHSSKFSIQQTIAHCIQLIQFQAKEKGIQILNDLSQLPLEIESDERRVTQIVLNLLSNALKFTFKGFIKVSGALFERERNHFMEIKVEDTGIGIKEQDISQLFKAFGMLQSAASINHSGIIFSLFIFNCFHLRNWVWSFSL